MDDRDVRVQEARSLAEFRYLSEPGVTLVGIGYRIVGGQVTDTPAIQIGVEEKKPVDALRPSEVIPNFINGVITDVIQTGKISVGEPSALATGRVRPAPPGASVGHFLVTAGTLGVWVRRGTGRERYMLSNNHVLANSNAARIGDSVYQPGRYDGGGPNDTIATLTEYVRINFNTAKKLGRTARYFWSAAKWGPNAIARAVGCPYRLVVSQPSPNLVDAAVAQVRDEADVALEIPSIGLPRGFRDFVLGEGARKNGRTTDLTAGRVMQVNASANVGYGGGRMARFRDQNVVLGNFSAPGDSGSAVMTDDGMVGGLLFAGGQGVTIINRISHVVRLLGLAL